jgi:hypothetical protein
VRREIAREAQKHLPGLTVAVETPRMSDAALPEATMLVVGSESLSSSTRVYLLTLAAAQDAVVVVDESDLFRTPWAARSKRLLKIGEVAAYRYVLTGTPIAKGIEDLYVPMSFLSWKVLGYDSFRQFERRHLVYSEERRGKIQRRLNSDYVTDRIAPYSFQVRKEDCLTLPAKSHVEWEFNMSDEQRRLYGQAKDEILHEYLDEQSEEAIYRLFSALMQISCGYWNRRLPLSLEERRKAIAEGKTPSDLREMIDLFPEGTSNPRLDLLSEAVEDISPDRQVVVWARLLYDVRGIVRTLGTDRCAVMTGEETDAEKAVALVRFRSGAARFLVCTQGTGGRGITLNEAHYAIFYSQGFKFADRLQAEDRMHRIGQTMPCTYITLQASKGIDQTISSCLRRRADAFKAFRDDLKATRTIKDKKEAEKKVREIFAAFDLDAKSPLAGGAESAMSVASGEQNTNTAA